MNLLNRLYVGTMLRINNFVEEFKNDEKGVSSIVATVLLILIVVLLAAIFWESIQTWFSDTWAKIMGKANTIS